MSKLRRLPVDNDSVLSQKDPVSHRIKAIRTRKGISQTDLAAAIEMERSNYHRMENRGQKLPLELLTKIAQALGVSLAQLILDEPLSETESQLEVDRLQRRTAELEDRLTDKRAIVQAFQKDQLALVLQVELSLIRLVAATWLTNSNLDSTQPAQGYINHQMVGPALEQFPFKEASCTILTKRFSGHELVYLALNINLTEVSFFDLVLKLIEVQVINPDSLYAQAFMYVRNTAQVYSDVFEQIARIRQPDQLES